MAICPARCGGFWVAPARVRVCRAPAPGVALAPSFPPGLRLAGHGRGDRLDRAHRVRAAGRAADEQYRFARHLDIGVRTVADWHDDPELRPRPANLPQPAWQCRPRADCGGHRERPHEGLPGRIEPDALIARRRRDPRRSRAHRARQMARMGTVRLPDRKAPEMARTRRVRMDRTPGRITRKETAHARISGRGPLALGSCLPPVAVGSPNPARPGVGG
jgi:hypothetical protein